MLPQFLYDALPFFYLGAGALTVVSIANIFAFISGAIFAITALYVFRLRGVI